MDPSATELPHTLLAIIEGIIALAALIGFFRIIGDVRAIRRHFEREERAPKRDAVLAFYRENPGAPAPAASHALGMDVETVRAIVAELTAEGKLAASGATKAHAVPSAPRKT